jgi:hypothetical protein
MTVFALWSVSDERHDCGRFRLKPDERDILGAGRDDMEMIEDVTATRVRRPSASASSIEDPWLSAGRFAV